MFWFGVVCSVLAIVFSQLSVKLNKKLTTFTPITSSSTVGRTAEQFKKEEQTIGVVNVTAAVLGIVGAIVLCVSAATYFTGV